MDNMIENPYEPPKSTQWQPEFSHDGLSLIGIKKTHFWLFIFLPFIIGFPLLMLGVGITSNEYFSDIHHYGFGSIGLGLIFIIFFTVFYFIYLYRIWKIVQLGGNARTTPSRAVGFCFIPVFRLYWYFIAFYELSKDYQKFCSQYQFKDYPKLSLSLFWWFVVLHAIVSISDRLPDSLYENIWFLVCALILILIYCILMLTVFYQICRAINYFYYLQEQR